MTTIYLLLLRYHLFLVMQNTNIFMFVCIYVCLLLSPASTSFSSAALSAAQPLRLDEHEARGKNRPILAYFRLLFQSIVRRVLCMHKMRTRARTYTYAQSYSKMVCLLDWTKKQKMKRVKNNQQEDSPKRKIFGTAFFDYHIISSSYQCWPSKANQSLRVALQTSLLILGIVSPQTKKKERMAHDAKVVESISLSRLDPWFMNIFSFWIYCYYNNSIIVCWGWGKNDA